MSISNANNIINSNIQLLQTVLNILKDSFSVTCRHKLSCRCLKYLNTLRLDVRNWKGLRGNCSQFSAHCRLQISDLSRDRSSSQIWMCLKNERYNAGCRRGMVGGLAETQCRTLLQVSPFSSVLSVTWTTQRMENQQRQRGCDGETLLHRLTLLYPSASLQGSCCHGHCEWKSVKHNGGALACQYTEHFSPFYLVNLNKLFVWFCVHSNLFLE